MRALQTELEYFRSHLEEWITVHPGKLALVKGERLVGIFDTHEAALAEGARRFGLTDFLVRRISREEPRATILTAGLTAGDGGARAHSPPSMAR